MAIYRSIVKAVQDGQEIQTIMGWKDFAAAEAGRAADLAEAIRIQWEAQFESHQVDDYAQTEVYVYSVDVPTVFASEPSSMLGTSTGDPAPMFVVARVDLTTGLRGRSYRGRWGFPGLPTGVIDPTNGNKLVAAEVSGLGAAVNAFYSGVTTGTSAVPAVISEVTNGAPRPAPIATEVTGIAVLQYLGSRTSRKN